MEDRFFDRVKNLVLADGMSKGEIPPSGNYRNGKWIYPADPTIDVGRDSQSAIAEFKAGLRTMSEIYGSKGEDYEESIRQRAKEVRIATDLAQEMEIPIESISDSFKPSEPIAPPQAPLPAVAEAELPEVPSTTDEAEVDDTEEEEVPTRARRTPKAITTREAEMILDAIEMQGVGDIDLSPNAGMIESAKSALRVRATKPASQRGMTQVGVARARDIINAKSLSPRSWRRMKNFFTRHEVDKQGSSWDEKGKGWQAWNGWGGDAGFARSKVVVSQLNKARDGK